MIVLELKQRKLTTMQENFDLNKANRSFENVAEFKQFGKTVSNQSLIQKEIMRKMNIRNAY
jgi:hypothetical protein